MEKIIRAESRQIDWNALNPIGETTLTDSSQYATVRLPDGREVTVTGMGIVVWE